MLIRRRDMTSRKSGALKRIEFLVLAVLADGPRHGYGITQEIHRRTRGEVGIRPGSLYRVLDRLVRMGFVHVAAEGPPRNDDRRTDYVITDQGKMGLMREARVLSAVARDVLASEPSA
jgi:DNA-binding PadR family transcriptional regulator